MIAKARVFCLALILCSLATGCASVPLDIAKTESFALTDTDNTFLAQSSRRWRKQDSRLNGFYPLLQGLDAFGARLALIDRAERSIDAQYFLMKPDAAGLVFAGKLIEAADRGVRVRLLLDDIFTTVDDRILKFLDSHPNIELNIFNPISRRGFYFFNYLGYFNRVNRRMHIKSFTVDNQVSIIGGRNIAEEYFQLGNEAHFFDFDLLGAGPLVQEISAVFDRYWNHRLAVPMTALYDDIDDDEMRRLGLRLEQQMSETGDSVYARAIDTPLMRDFYAARLEPYLASATVISDEPQKLLEKIDRDQQKVARGFADRFNRVQREVIIFTPYFIPGRSGVELIRNVTARGVRVTLVTNSLASNNHTVVHSAYSSYRRAMLEAGVELWEARVDPTGLDNQADDEGPESLTLHNKVILIDRRYLITGSLNLDPRSVEINAELGMIIDSAELAGRLSDLARATIPQRAYRLELEQDKSITWHATIGSKRVVETSEPQTSLWRRFKAWLLKIAPEKQL